MTESRNSLKTFSSEDVDKIIEGFKRPDIKYVKGAINFEESGSFAILSVETDKELFRGDDSDHQPSGIFLLFPKYDLIQLVKDVFDLRDK